MPLLDVEVSAPNAAPLMVQFANGKSVSVAPGTRSRFALTGDEVGRVEHLLRALIAQTYYSGVQSHLVTEAMISAVEPKAGVSVLTKDFDKVPKGSKKYLLMVADGRIKVSSKEKAEVVAVLAAASGEEAEEAEEKPRRGRPKKET